MYEHNLVLIAQITFIMTDISEHDNQGVQCRMVLVVNFFVFWKLLLFAC